MVNPSRSTNRTRRGQQRRVSSRSPEPLLLDPESGEPYYCQHQRPENPYRSRSPSPMTRLENEYAGLDYPASKETGGNGGWPNGPYRQRRRQEDLHRERSPSPMSCFESEHAAAATTTADPVRGVSARDEEWGFVEHEAKRHWYRVGGRDRGGRNDGNMDRREEGREEGREGERKEKRKERSKEKKSRGIYKGVE